MPFEAGRIMPRALITALVASVSCLFALTASGDSIEQRIKQCKEEFWVEFRLVIEEYREKVPQELTKGLEDKESKRQFFEEWGRAVKEAEDMLRQKREAQLDTLPITAEGLAECEAMLPPKEKRRKK